MAVLLPIPSFQLQVPQFKIANITMTDTKMADSQHLEAAEGKVSGDNIIVVTERMSSQVKKKVSS